MIRWLLRRGIKQFSKRYDYDATYMHQVTDASLSAGIRLSAFPFISQYRGPPEALEVWAGALLASTLDGDCGPCAQLVLDMACEAGIDGTRLKACLEGHEETAGDVGLGFKFARSAILGDLMTDDLRQEIEQKFGPRSAVSAAFAATSGRMYPVLKRALGHGATCSMLTIGGVDVPLRPAT